MKVIRETIELPVQPNTLGWNGDRFTSAARSMDRKTGKPAIGGENKV